MKKAILNFEQECNKQLHSSRKVLKDRQKKILTSLLEHWQGLTVFVDEPSVPLDNNRGENGLRGPVVGRKNYYGSMLCTLKKLTTRIC